MPKSPQKWPFPNRTILSLGRDTPVCHARSCFDPAKWTQSCATPVSGSPGRVDFPRGSIFSIFGPFLALFTLLCSLKYKT
ncbi:hypothetical protein F383_03495 [Gossypium arboreum]|uniref:Uncharacterized protein n=1 Tax=Gossypium arboreum TaxID=29729 RepID=A0A0B0NN05_GOSAR|nr:hypothetical protein F383_03495 [Gossypium arboreum]